MDTKHYLLVCLFAVLLQSTIIVNQSTTIDRLTNSVKQHQSQLEYKHKEVLRAWDHFSDLLNSLDHISRVDVTTYNPVESQTDSTPLITASGEKIDPDGASDLRWVAISRNLQSRWGGPLKFGDLVYLVGAGDSFDGIYTVHDNMNPRFTNRVDILRTQGDSHTAVYGKKVSMFRIKKSNRQYYLAEDRNDSDKEIRNNSGRADSTSGASDPTLR